MNYLIIKGFNIYNEGYMSTIGGLLGWGHIADCPRNKELECLGDSSYCIELSCCEDVDYNGLISTCLEAGLVVVFQ